MRSSENILSQKRHRLRPSELYEVYKVLRKTFGHQHWWPGQTPFEVMVGAILTQNTAWTNVEKAILNLKKAGKLSLNALRLLPKKKLAVLIRPAGYFNIKADRLKHFIRFFIREYQGDLRRMRREPLAILRQKLLRVNGVGPETADSILLYALNKRAFVIDAYTKRIFARHGAGHVTDPYEDWQKLFVGALPRNTALYNDYHAQIVRVAKNYCRKAARCHSCPLRHFF